VEPHRDPRRLQFRAVTRLGRVQLTSRSGVLKGARSRVIIGENAKWGRGLAEQSALSQRCCMGDSFSAAMDLFPHALDARVGHPAKMRRREGGLQEQLQTLSSKLQGKDKSSRRLTQMNAELEIRPRIATDPHGLTRRYPARSGERCLYEFSKT